jgi:hypothetical protein
LHRRSAFQRLSDFFVIRKRHDAIADNLACFVSFASDQHNIARLHHANRRRYRLRPAPDFARSNRANKNLAANDGRIFRARIVVGHDRHVGFSDGDAAHNRALAFIAIAAATEDGDEPARRKRPARIERRCKRFRLCA